MRPQRPGTWMPSLTIWLCTAWWFQLTLNPLQSQGSLIRKTIEMYLPEWLVATTLGVLVVLGLITGLWCRSPWLRTTYYLLSFICWSMAAVFTVTSDLWSTGTGSYGLICAPQSLWLVFTVGRAHPTSEQVGLFHDRPRQSQPLPKVTP